MMIIIEPEIAHEIYMIVAANRVKPKKSRIELSVDDSGKVIAFTDIS